MIARAILSVILSFTFLFSFSANSQQASIWDKHNFPNPSPKDAIGTCSCKATEGDMQEPANLSFWNNAIDSHPNAFKYYKDFDGQNLHHYMTYYFPKLIGGYDTCVRVIQTACNAQCRGIKSLWTRHELVAKPTFFAQWSCETRNADPFFIPSREGDLNHQIRHVSDWQDIDSFAMAFPLLGNPFPYSAAGKENLLYPFVEEENMRPFDFEGFDPGNTILKPQEEQMNLLQALLFVLIGAAIWRPGATMQTQSCPVIIAPSIGQPDRKSGPVACIDKKDNDLVDKYCKLTEGNKAQCDLPESGESLIEMTPEGLLVMPMDKNV